MNNILIVGAGVAGLAAAEQFVQAGFSPRIIDKASQPGGRCATRRSAEPADADWFDYGAQYFTVRDDDFRNIVDSDLRAGRLTCWQPSIAIAEQVADTWLLSPSPDDRERLIGPSGLNAWVGARLTAAGLTVECYRRARAVEPTDHGWQITCDDGQTEAARGVLLTPPAAQAAALLGDRAASIEPLFETDTALTTCHAFVVEAPALADAQAIFFKSGRLSWAANNTHKAGRDRERHLWTLHTDADYSQRHVDVPAADLAGDIIAEFAAATAQSVDNVRLVRAHRWRYARPGAGAPDEDQTCWIDPTRGLAIAGDWLAGGRVEGAWLSGRTAALLLIDALAAA